MLLELILALGASQYIPTQETEGLRVDAPKPFAVAHRAQSDFLNVVEMVKPPETVNNWTQMISVATMMGASERAELDDFYALWRTEYGLACPGTDGWISRGKVDGHKTIKATLFCPEDPKTGRPESLVAYFIAGKVNVLTTHVAFRRSMTAADRNVVRQVERSLKVCDSRDSACRAGKASGFLAGR